MEIVIRYLREVNKNEIHKEDKTKNPRDTDITCGASQFSFPSATQLIAGIGPARTL